MFKLFSNFKFLKQILLKPHNKVHYYYNKHILSLSQKTTGYLHVSLTAFSLLFICEKCKVFAAFGKPNKKLAARRVNNPFWRHPLHPSPPTFTPIFTISKGCGVTFLQLFCGKFITKCCKLVWFGFASVRFGLV